MNKVFFIILLFVSFNGYGRELSADQKEAVSAFISLVENRDWIGLSETITYPLRRDHPLADIGSKEDFMAEQNDLFDDSLINMITNSHPDSNWYVVGSRGLRMMLGEIWLNNAGELIAINYQTETAKSKEIGLIEADREALPVFLQEYERPILTMDVGKWVIRIDQTKGMSYRFVGWIQGNRNPNRPAVEIIFNGFLEYQGSGGNHTYTFKNEIGTFVCYVNELGADDTPEGELVIFRDGEEYRRYASIELER
ncbi:MAG: hypothetical protein P8P74_06005 [Crocinitomicaceae bacterium]|nr:hypothetical protein [Crocinitomicaceae bacterium]